MEFKNIGGLNVCSADYFDSESLNGLLKILNQIEERPLTQKGDKRTVTIQYLSAPFPRVILQADVREKNAQVSWLETYDVKEKRFIDLTYENV